MGALQHYLKLRFLAKTGFAPGMLVWALVALVCIPFALAFLISAAYAALAEQYGSLFSALVLAAGFLFVAIVALIVCITLHSRTKERAKLELAARQTSPWLDPSLVGVALQTRQLGGRWLVALVALVALPLAAAAGLHWYSQRRLPPPA
jgi:hypothetical protein